MLCGMDESAYPCPVCFTLTTLEQPCPGCGRAPDPHAAAVITLDQQILELSAKVQAAKLEYEALSARLTEMHRQRENHATLVRNAVAAEKQSVQAEQQTVNLAAMTAPVVAAPKWTPAPEQTTVAVRAEAAPRTVQNLLFILGGLLLGTAAIVFTAVAWANYGLVARAAILSIVTLITLSVPPLVLKRGLRATAETFASLGMLLIVLDGYAAWYVNFLDVQRMDGSLYAGTVAAVTTVAGYFYGTAFKLSGPLYLALVTAQPVLPLYFGNAGLQSPGWAMVFAVVAAGNVLVIWRSAGNTAQQAIAWVMHGIMFLTAFAFGAAGLLLHDSLEASAAIVVVALALAAGAAVSGQAAHRGLAGAGIVLASIAAVLRPMVDQLTNEGIVLAAAAAALAAVLVIFGFSRYLQNPWLAGATWGSIVALCLPGVVSFGWALTRGALTAAAAVPWWHAGDMELLEGPYHWEMPVALALALAASALLPAGRTRKVLVILGIAALAFALPGAPPVAIWAPSTVDLVAATGLLVWALLVPGRLGLIAKSATAAILVWHAILAGQATPALGAAVFGAVAVLGLFVSAVAPKGLLRPAVTIDGRHELAGVAAGVTDLVIPLLGFTLVAVFGGDLVSSWRTMAVLVLIVPLLGSGRQFRGYHVVAGLVTALYLLWPDLPGNESPAFYAALSAVAMTLAGLRCSWSWVKWTPLLPGLISLMWAKPVWYALILEPFAQVTRIWEGRGATPEVGLWSTVALTLLLVPIAVNTRSVKLTAVAAILPALAWLAFSGVPWPVIPAVSLLGGLAGIVVATLRQGKATVAVLGVVLTLSGLAGTLPRQWTTITALALISVVMAFVGVRIGIPGWIAGAVAKVLLAFSIGQAADLELEVTAYLVLAVAAILLGLGYLFARDSRTALEASAHSAALVALSLCIGAPHHAAGVLAIWGVLIGLTGLVHQPVARATIAAVVEAIAWIVLMRAQQVETLEAYTLPVAVLAVGAGIFAAARKGGLTSWVAYGPALAAALLPSLGAVLIESGAWERRLLLGTGALIVVVGGAIWRKQAPFVLGGITLLILAAHEIALVWQFMDAWIPLAVFGLLLVGMAITYERRLRDLSRLRSAVSRMT